MKKGTKIVLGSLLVLGLIGGCTDTEETEVQEEQVQTEQVEEQEVEEEVVVEEEKPKTMQDIFLEQGVPENKIDSLMNTLRQIAGNDKYIIDFVGDCSLSEGSGRFTINITQSDSWTADGISVNLTIYEGEIRLANSGDYQLYNKDNGGLQLSYAQLVLTDEEEVYFREIAEYVMTNMAQNPGTVEFSWFTTKNVVKREADEVLVQGVMTCQNGLGITLKYLYQVKLNYNTGELLANPYYEQIA